jgi:hypothetical protein
MLRQYYLSNDLFSPIGKAQRINKKNLRKLLFGAANSPHVAYWRGKGALPLSAGAT